MFQTGFNRVGFNERQALSSYGLTSKGSVGTVAVLTGLTFAGSVIIEFLVAVAVSTGLRGGITFKPD